MNKKFISVFMMGAATLAPLSTLVSCSDYDDDINNLQAQIDASGVNLKEEVSKLQKLLDECKAAAEKADADLEQAIKNATNDAKGYADIQAEQAKQAAIAALQAQLSQAIADLENGAIADAKARAEQAYNLAEQTSKLANSNKAELEKLAKELETVNTDLQKAIEALQTRMTAAEAAIAEVKTQAAENKAQLTTLETTLNALKASNETAHKALSDKDDELKNLIEANQTEIEGKLANEVSAINTKLGEVNTTISLEAGHDYAITVNTDSRTLLTSLDLTALQGVWLLSDGSGSGLRIGPDGEASSIGTFGMMTLRSWSISNGRLQFAYVANDGTNYDEQQDVAHIMALTPTRLQFSFGGMQYELQRP